MVDVSSSIPMPEIPARLVGFTSEVGKACDPDDSNCAAGGLGVTRKCSCKFVMAGFPANGPNGELNCWVCFSLFVSLTESSCAESRCFC